MTERGVNRQGGREGKRERGREGEREAKGERSRGREGGENRGGREGERKIEGGNGRCSGDGADCKLGTHSDAGDTNNIVWVFDVD